MIAFYLQTGKLFSRRFISRRLTLIECPQINADFLNQKKYAGNNF
jgi:hypothetical protein